jgi:hypothetical protein
MIGRLVRSLTGVSFQRGLAIGALVGAAIAGSTLWGRLRATANERAPGWTPPPEA